MKKTHKARRKLKFSRDTIRHLEPGALHEIVGASATCGGTCGPTKFTNNTCATFCTLCGC